MVLLSEHEGIEGLRFAVTGGLGCVGAALCLELMQRGAEEVRCFDSRTASPFLASLKRNRVTCISGDIKSNTQVEKALDGVDCVFHLASHGICGKQMLQAGQIDAVNLTGTCNILDSCMKCGVERLVYASTYSVVFGGQQINNGNESLDYFPIETHLDSYGRSKALAEQLVLKSNGRPLKGKNGRKLRTCAIRPGAIYGPGEEHLVPRFLSLAQRGLFLFRIGGPEVKTDWVYVDNLVQALLLASMGLIDDIPGRKGASAAGQAYFISDGSPVNSFSFVQPLIEELGYQLPSQQLSVKSAMVIAWFFWGLYGLLYPWLEKSWLPEPPILPAEVHQVGVSHYFNPLKARQQLGYVPFVEPKEGMRRTIDFWKDKQAHELLSPQLHWWILILSGLLLNFLCAFVPPPYLGPLESMRSFFLNLFRTREILKIIFVLAFFMHLVEGSYAFQLARKVDHANAKAWCWQTFILGFPSLRLLRKRAKRVLHSKQ